jgi:hypothetical protein
MELGGVSGGRRGGGGTESPKIFKPLRPAESAVLRARVRLSRL